MDHILNSSDIKIHHGVSIHKYWTWVVSVWLRYKHVTCLVSYASFSMLCYVVYATPNKQVLGE